VTRSSPVRPLGKALVSVATWSRDAELLLPVGREWTVDCPCIVFEDDRYTEVDPRIEFAGIHYAFAASAEQVESIVRNCCQRLGRDPTDVEAWQAFLRLHEHDAGIVAARPRPT